MGKIIFGLFWILIGVLIISIAVINFYFIPIPEEPSLPEGLPTDILHNPNERASSDQVYIYFDSIKTLDYAWGGKNPLLIITSPISISLSATTTNASLGGLIENTATSVTPYLSASLEKDELLHQRVSGRAEMDVGYAVTVSGRDPGVPYDRYKIDWKHVEQNVHFYVVTPDEENAIEAHNNWEGRVNIKSNDSWTVLIGLVGFVLPGVLLVRYAFRKRKFTYRERKYIRPNSTYGL
jgi:hypothetical protein